MNKMCLGPGRHRRRNELNRFADTAGSPDSVVSHDLRGQNAEQSRRRNKQKEVKEEEEEETPMHGEAAATELRLLCISRYKLKREGDPTDRAKEEWRSPSTPWNGLAIFPRFSKYSHDRENYIFKLPDTTNPTVTWSSRREPIS